jgi:hypothetical protein
MRRFQLAFFMVLCAAAARAEEDAAPAVEEQWGILQILGQPVGHVHTVFRRTAERVETTIVSKMTIKRLGREVTVEQTNFIVERPDGQLVSWRSVQKMSAAEMKSETTFKDGKAHMVTTTMGTPHETVLDCPAEAIGPARIERLQKEMSKAAGTKLEATTFSPDLGGALRLTITVVGEEETELLDGEKRTLTRIETVPDKVPITTVTWSTKEGELRKSSMAVGGLVIVTQMTTRERALGAKGGELAPDLFKRMLIVAKHPVPYPRRIETARLEIRSEKALPELAGSNQVVEVKANGNAYVRIRSARPPRSVPRPLEPAEAYAGCLESNSMIQCDAPEIRAIAQEVVGDEEDAWRAAQTLERWVYDNLTEKSLGVGFASALEVCRNREGDCTEHAVFLAALCRAAGIPARVAMGFEYIAGVWAGHAWNEVWIDGRWYALDATNGRGWVDALHLTLSTMTLKDGDMGREFLDIATWIGKLEIDVDEVTWNGRTMRPAAPTAVTVEGDRYVNRLWGLAFKKPAGYEFDRKAPGGMSMRLLELDGRTAGGKQVEIEIDAFEAPVGFTWPEFSKRLGWPGSEPTEVDGRPARHTTLQRGGRVEEHVAVLAGDALFLFRVDRVETAAEKEAFQAFLASVDFDVTR